MSAREIFSFRNPYCTASVGIALALFILTAPGGFIVLPYAQRELQFAGLWDAICSAAGLPRGAAPLRHPVPLIIPPAWCLLRRR
jgi:hypothetical protein